MRQSPDSPQNTNGPILNRWKSSAGGGTGGGGGGCGVTQTCTDADNQGKDLFYSLGGNKMRKDILMRDSDFQVSFCECDFYQDEMPNGTYPKFFGKKPR